MAPWIIAIQDPTERGLCWIALAIVISAAIRKLPFGDK
jgi:hypothetical protein